LPADHRTPTRGLTVPPWSPPRSTCGRSSTT
jgi:hypothetical protein